MAQCMVASHKDDADQMDASCLNAVGPDGDTLNQKSFMATLEAAIQSKNSPSLVPVVKLEMPAAEVQWRPGMSAADGMTMNSGVAAVSGCNSSSESDIDKDSLAAYKELCTTHQEARGVVMDGGVGEGSGKLTHPCHVCAGRYPTWSHLRRHLQTHTGYRPHACHSCAKRFRNYSKLKRHLLTHTGAKPHRCPICDRTVSRAEHLKRHLLVHSEQRPYKCGACDYSARRLDSLRTHQRNKHGEQETRVLYMGEHDDEERLLDANDLYPPTEVQTPEMASQRRKKKKKSKLSVAKEYGGVSAETLLQHVGDVTGYEPSAAPSGAGNEPKCGDSIRQLEQMHGKSKYCLNPAVLYHEQTVSQHQSQQQQQNHHQQQQNQQQHQSQHLQQNPQQHCQQQQQQTRKHMDQQQQQQQKNHQHIQQPLQNQQQKQSNTLIPSSGASQSRCSTPEVSTMSMLKQPPAITAPIRSASVDTTMDAHIMARQQLMAQQQQCGNAKSKSAVEVAQKFQPREPLPIPYGGVPVSGYIQEAKLKPRLWEPPSQQAGQAYGASYAPFPTAAAYFGQPVVPPDPYLANRYFMPEHSIAAAAAAAFDAHTQGFYMPRPSAGGPTPTGRAESPAHSIASSPMPDFFRKRIRQECDQINRMTQSPAHTDTDSNY